MGRTYVINGETLVKVKGNGALQDPDTGQAGLWELGLAQAGVEVAPKWTHKDVYADDFPNVPAELLWMLAEVWIGMTLINYDSDILDAVITESMGGGDFGTLVGTGLPMGGGVEVFEEGNHYISLNLTSPVLNKPWRFRATVLAGQPVVLPLGTGATAAVLNWRCIPYKFPQTTTAGVPRDMLSNGLILWDSTPDD